MKMKIVVAFFVSMLAVGALYAASTIGTNIVTTGTLEVTGTSTLGNVVATNIAGYLKLNQTTPQIITNGAPIFGEAFDIPRGKVVRFGQPADPFGNPDGQITSAVDNITGLTSLAVQAPFGSLVLHGGGTEDGEGVIVPDHLYTSTGISPQIPSSYAYIGTASLKYWDLFAVQAHLDQVVVGNNTTTTAGAIRFDGTHFYGYDGSQWKQLDN